MGKIKPKTAVGRFLEQLPEGFEQQLVLSAGKSTGASSSDKFGESLIFELPSGKKVKFIAKLIDPTKCKVWKGNIRLQEYLNEENTNKLKEKIKAQGQLVPVLARPIKDDAQFTHEIIYGSRRHYVCSSLGINIKILEADLDDNDALVFMDAENSGREDLSPYEMAMAYKFWIENGIFKSQGELSERLGITRSWLNKIISLTKIPKEIVATVSGPSGLSLKHGLELAKILIDNPSRTTELVEKAKDFHMKRLSPEHILQKLLNQGVEVHEEEKSNIEELMSKVLYSSNGKLICKISNSKRGKTILTFNPSFPRSELSNLLDEIEQIIKKRIG